MTIKVPLKCPHCRKDLQGIAERLSKLMDENRRLRKAFTNHDDDCAAGVIFVASDFRKHFHRPGCRWAQYISKSHLEEFFSHKEAVEAGKKPCKTCCA